jgi:hypothetical protein
MGADQSFRLEHPQKDLMSMEENSRRKWILAGSAAEGENQEK